MYMYILYISMQCDKNNNTTHIQNATKTIKNNLFVVLYNSQHSNVHYMKLNMLLKSAHKPCTTRVCKHGKPTMKRVQTLEDVFKA